VSALQTPFVLPLKEQINQCLNQVFTLLFPEEFALPDMAALQYEAEVLTNQCAVEKDAVLEELNRIQQVVATFQAQIFQVLQ